MAIISNAISNDVNDPLSIASRWGIEACEYSIDGRQVDLQDLMITVSENRAVAVEREVSPQSTRIRNRNAELDKYGKVLGYLTEYQSYFDDEAEGTDVPEAENDEGDEYYIYFKEDDDLPKVLAAVGYPAHAAAYDSWEGNQFVRKYKYYLTKAENEGAIQAVKAAVDGMNNAAQLDMSRLQQLVDRRDESYSTATNLMTAISDTRANLIRNL